MNSFRNFMRGRYGADQLSLALLVFGVLLSFFFRLFPSILPFVPLYLLTYVPFGFAVFRALSRNITKRAAENVKFLNLWYRIKTKVKEMRSKSKNKGGKNRAYDAPPPRPNKMGQSKQSSTDQPPSAYSFIKCPHCGQPIRLPKGRQLQVTCPACKATFQQRT